MLRAALRVVLFLAGIAALVAAVPAAQHGWHSLPATHTKAVSWIAGESGDNYGSRTYGAPCTEVDGGVPCHADTIDVATTWQDRNGAALTWAALPLIAGVILLLAAVRWTRRKQTT